MAFGKELRGPATDTIKLFGDEKTATFERYARSGAIAEGEQTPTSEEVVQTVY